MDCFMLVSRLAEGFIACQFISMDCGRAVNLSRNKGDKSFGLDIGDFGNRKFTIPFNGSRVWMWR